MPVSLDKLPATKRRSKKRLGRGYASGKGGHTVGRGAKGAKARGKVGLAFEGTKFKKSLIRRLPFRRGKGRFNSLRTKPIVVNLASLNLLPKGTVVDLESLVKYRIVSKKEGLKRGVRILGGGSLGRSLTVAVPCSRSAQEKIEKAGGKVVGKQGGNE